MVTVRERASQNEMVWPTLCNLWDAPVAYVVVQKMNSILLFAAIFMAHNESWDRLCHKWSIWWSVVTQDKKTVYEEAFEMEQPSDSL